MRDCGVLLHISSLPSPYGIGDLGGAAYEFVDFLSRAGQTYWQVLPVNPTSFGDSPYQSPSVFAGNPYFVDLQALCDEGFLTESEIQSARVPVGKVDYGKLFRERMPLLKKAFGRFDASDKGFSEFCAANAYWLDSYALFAVLKDEFALAPHWEWKAEYRNPDGDAVKKFAEDNRDGLNFIRFVQYEFDVQWRKLKTYANDRGIKLFGDTPIYAAYDSVDFWSNPRRFITDGEGKPTEVAGVPPDYFSRDGQLWGNPLYDWQYLGEHGYDFWTDRIRRSFELFDVLRIDHFRGFEGFYAIPADSDTAVRGKWRTGPGKALFEVVEGALGKQNIVAEDLGVDSDSLREMLRECGYPGMKVVQFGFDGKAKRNAHAIRNYSENYVGYTGTHDNDTALGWVCALTEKQQKRVRRRLPKMREDIVMRMICALYASPVKTAIVPMQDWLRENSDARMNTPGTREGNWQYRISAIPDEKTCGQMLAVAEKYGRARTDK